jgi:hypothetical protein
LTSSPCSSSMAASGPPWGAQDQSKSASCHIQEEQKNKRGRRNNSLDSSTWC